jgi:hypothetical protein
MHLQTRKIGYWSPPDLSGYPSADTTGPAAAGYTNLIYTVSQDLTGVGPMPSWVVAQSDGSWLVEGRLFDSPIHVYVANVTFRGCEWVYVNADIFAITAHPGADGLTVSYCSAHSPAPEDGDTYSHNHVRTIGLAGVYANGATLDHNHVYWVVGGFLVAGTGLTMTDNYIHDTTYWDLDHNDCFQHSGGGVGMTIRHNRFEEGKWGVGRAQTSAIALFQDFPADFIDVLVEDNLIAGGGYAMYCGYDVATPGSNVRIINNKFSTMFYPNGGFYGPKSRDYPWDPNTGIDANGNEWNGNIWADGPNAGKVIPV